MRANIQAGGYLPPLHYVHHLGLWKIPEAPIGKTEEETLVFSDLKSVNDAAEAPERVVGTGKSVMFVLSFLLSILFFAGSCEPYEPVAQNIVASTVNEEEPENQLKPPGKEISAFANGAEFMLYFTSATEKFQPLYQGVERYSGNIEIPDDAPLDLWLVTTPGTQDSVWLEVGCIHVSSVNRIRMIIRI
jgi:hypothetical protein